MVDQTLLTVFVALTALAVLIQTGILVGFYYISTKLSRQADQAIDVSRNVLGPLQSTLENVKAVTAQIAEVTSKAPGQLRQLEQWLKRRTA
jgi:predicted PurR-regulated permease PerM